MPEDKISTKVIAYITQGNRLLVFEHEDYPEAGIQVPAGTVEPGEDLEAAVLREAFEESGLVNLQVKRLLATEFIDMRQFGKNEIQKRVFFHLLCRQKTPSRWTHIEQFPSGGTLEAITFQFYWLDLMGDIPNLAGGQGALLEQLKSSR